MYPGKTEPMIKNTTHSSIKKLLRTASASVCMKATGTIKQLAQRIAAHEVMPAAPAPLPSVQLSEEDEDEDVITTEQLQEVEEQLTAAVQTGEGQEVLEGMMQEQEEEEDVQQQQLAPNRDASNHRSPFTDITSAILNIPGATAAATTIPARTDSLPATTAATAMDSAAATAANVALDGTAAGGGAIPAHVQIPIQQAAAAGSAPAGKGRAKMTAAEVAAAAGTNTADTESMDAAIAAGGAEGFLVSTVQAMLAGANGVATSIEHSITEGTPILICGTIAGILSPGIKASWQVFLHDGENGWRLVTTSQFQKEGGKASHKTNWKKSCKVRVGQQQVEAKAWLNGKGM